MKAVSKGTGLLECMRQNMKDRWVTAADVRAYCARGGDYTREVLEDAAKSGLLERMEKSEPRILYRIDPPLGFSDPVCEFEPDVPYEKSVCIAIENAIEDCAESKYSNNGTKSGSCDLVEHFKRGLFFPATSALAMDHSAFYGDFLQNRAELLREENPHINIQSSLVV